jgi:oligoribonuclease
MTNKLFWIDLEMTGLDIDKEVIIEAAIIITDLDLKPLTTYHAIVKQDQSYLDKMDKWNTTHHGASGLTASVPNGKDLALVEEDLIKLVDKYFPGERAVMAGNSISQDRLFINKYFKKLSERLHYRTVDVTSWKIIFNEKNNIKYDKKNTHRALDDVMESISELQFYLNYVDPTKAAPSNADSKKVDPI